MNAKYFQYLISPPAILGLLTQSKAIIRQMQRLQLLGAQRHRLE